MDPSLSNSLMKSPISLKQDSLRWNTFVLIDSATTLSFFSQIPLNQKGLVGKCIQVPKTVVHERKKFLTRGHMKDIGSTVGIQSYP